MEFECTLSNDREVKATIPIPKSKAGAEKMAVETAEPKETSFEVIKRMNFTSDRKRMSILIRDPSDGKTKLLVKGADSIIQERLAKTELPEHT